MQRMMYMRLRHGYRNVVMAVVDQGVVSYLRIADSAFGKKSCSGIRVALRAISAVAGDLVVRTSRKDVDPRDNSTY